MGREPRSLFVVGPFLALALLAAACGSWEIVTDASPRGGFAQYRTYAWVPWEEMPPPDPEMQNVGVAQWIKAAIDEELGARGLELTDSAPDIRVCFRVSVTDALGKTQWGYGYGAGDGTMSTSNYREGCLVIYVDDPQKKERVWLGSARGVVPTGPDREERLREVIRDLIADFPTE